MRRFLTAVALSSITAASPLALARPRAPEKAAAPAAATPRTATPATMSAVLRLMGRYRWGMSPEQALKLATDDVDARFRERIQKERDPFKQDLVRRELAQALEKVKEGYVKFDGQKTGWDVSLIDREFAHNNGEAMLVIWEKDQRRFLFFHDDKMWKQFVAFNADHPAFAGKTFEDFAEIVQRSYGPASVTFRKQRSNDEQTFDHLEWAVNSDYELWAIDLTTLYNNFCLSLFQRSAVASIEKGRMEHPVARPASSAALVEAATAPSTVQGDANVDIVDEITGRSAERTNQGALVGASSRGQSTKKRAARSTARKEASKDPLAD